MMVSLKRVEVFSRKLEDGADSARPPELVLRMPTLQRDSESALLPLNWTSPLL